MKKLKNQIAEKLKRKSGETLAEVLIALLIAALALTMLASTIASSSKMITQSKQKMESYYAANDSLAEKSGDSKLTMTLKLGGESGTVVKMTNAAITVNYNVNDEAGAKKVIAYWLGAEGD